MDEQTNTPNQSIIVVAVIINEERKALILKRAVALKRAPGKWEFPSGQVSFGQEPLEALVKIVRNKTSLDIEVGKLIASKSFVSKRSKKHVIIFYNLAKPSEDFLHTQPKLDGEYTESKWVDMKEIQQLNLEKDISDLFGKLKLYLASEDKINHIDVKISTSDELYIYTDGGSRGNPGPSASGFVIMNSDMEVLEEGGEYLGITTNNQAEYQAVKLALKMAKKYNPKHINFRIDSMLVVNQMKGFYKIKSKDLWPIHEDIKKLAAEFELVTYEHVRREENTLADAKVNEVLDSQKGT